MVDFTQAKVEQRRQVLQQQIADREMQLWGRQRDIDVWKRFRNADISAATSEDERIENNRADACKQNLAQAFYDCTHLEIQLAALRDDLAALEKGASKAVAREASKQ